MFPSAPSTFRPLTVVILHDTTRSARGCKFIIPIIHWPCCVRATRFVPALTKTRNLSHKLTKPGALHLDIGQRTADIDRSKTDSRGERAVEQAFAETRGKFRREPMPDELLDHVVAERDASGQDDVGDDHARELEQRQRAGPRAVKRRKPAQHAQI